MNVFEYYPDKIDWKTKLILSFIPMRRKVEPPSNFMDYGCIVYYKVYNKKIYVYKHKIITYLEMINFR